MRNNTKCHQAMGPRLLKYLALFCALESVGAAPTSSSSSSPYTLMNEAKSWSDAKDACEQDGLQLASVRSAAENALLVTAADGNIVWIGGTDGDSENTWVWSPSGTALSYTNWYTGEPNNSGEEHCLDFNYHWVARKLENSEGKWNDAKCSRKQKYVCQNVMPPPSLPPPSPPLPPPSPPPPSSPPPQCTCLAELQEIREFIGMTPPASPPFDIADGHTCSSGYVPLVSSWQECRTAAISLGFAGDSIGYVDYVYPWGNGRPQGCFKSAGNGRIHFNLGPGGAHVTGDQIICTPPSPSPPN